MFVTTLPIQDAKNPPVLKFPARCVHCGAATTETLPMNLSMGVQKRSKPVLLKFSLPMCAQGGRLERGVAKVTLVPFLVGGLLMGAAGFFLGAILTPAPPLATVQTRFLALAVGALVGLVAGILGGTALEAVCKLFFTPVYGKMLLARPLTAIEILSDTETYLGFSVALSKDKKQLRLTFEHDEVGREFQRLNS
ncbi:MAG: hypothetical protein DDG60_05300 [Anaerolineae bacterium]|nr:MAG: hypothetical protein DDG60_05300 [Anaerolineae bacterium]